MIKLEPVYKSLNIEEKEVTPVLLLIAQSIFIGIFYGAFDIGAHTLFLNVFPENMIPKAYIISGLVGIVLTAIFSKIQSKIFFSKLANYSLIFISVVIVLLWLLFGILPIKVVVFIVFIFFGPLNIIAILAFWGTVSRIFNLRQGKRLFGIIDTGQIIGIIISSFGIPLIITFLQGTKNILLISALSISMAMLLEVIISKKYNLNLEAGHEDNKEDSDSTENTQSQQVKLKDFTKNPYILYMALFVVFSMFAAFFVQYSFLVVTKEKFPIEDDLAKYLGFFTGSMMVFTLLIKTFVYSKLLKTYGLKVGLILSPILLGLFTLIALLAGFFGGFTQTSSGFIYFFLLISLSKLFNKTLKDALEVPSFKLLYQALAKKIRFDVQAKIDGTINEIAALTSGLILYGLGLLFFVKLIHFSLVLFILLAIWTFITVKLYAAYRNNLEKSLKSTKEDDVAGQEMSELTINVLDKEDSTQIMDNLSLIFNNSPLKYKQVLTDIITNPSTQINSFNSSKVHLIELYFLFIKGNFKSVLKPYFDKIIQHKSKIEYSSKELSRLLVGDNASDYLLAISYIFSLPAKDRITLLTSLLRFPDMDIQRITLRICGELAEKETCSTLVEYLDINEMFSSAIISLSQMAKVCHAQLIQMFYKTDITNTVQLSIIKLLGYVPEKAVESFLLENLSHHRLDIFNQSIQSLKRLKYQANEKEQPRFFHPITQTIQTLAWDVSAMASMVDEKESTLNQLLTNEYLYHRKILIDLLSITYESKSVMHVKEYLESDTIEGIGYALELFDLFISEEIKPLVLLIFDDINMVEKARLLQNYFPVEIMTTEQLILNIINRDPNLISLEIKKHALELYTQYFTKITNDIIAQLFNPVQSLKYQAAKVINNMNPQTLSVLYKRIKSKEVKEIEVLLQENTIQEQSKLIIDAAKHKFIDLFVKYNINPNELADYLSAEVIAPNKFININEAFSDYFVFLIRNLETELPSQTTELAEEHICFEHFYKNREVLNNHVNDIVIVGIKKSKMIKLQLTNPDFIQNLLILV